MPAPVITPPPIAPVVGPVATVGGAAATISGAAATVGVVTVVGGAAAAWPAGTGSAVTDGKVQVWRVFGGAAGPVSADDAKAGTWFTLFDPSKLTKNSEYVRQVLALPPSWGNDLSKVVTGMVDPKFINQMGVAGPQSDLTTNKTYVGGAPEVRISNAAKNVIFQRVSPSGIQ